MPTPNNENRKPLLPATGVLLAALYWKLGSLPNYLKVTPTYVALFGVIFAIFLGACWLFTRPGENRRTLWLILAFAVLFRVILFPSPRGFSTDVHRYIWDGKVVSAGLGPWHRPPSAPELAPLRDNLYPAINYPDVVSPYPPAGMLLYAALTHLPGPKLVTFKLGFVLFDLATIWVILGILKTLGRRPEWVILYAWHPLAITEVTLGPHVDAAGTFFLFLALRFAIEARKWLPSSIALALAALIKPHPAFLVPLMLRRNGFRYVLPAIATAALLFIPFRAGIHEFIAANRVIANWLEVNSSLYYAIDHLFGPAGHARAIGLAVAVLAPIALSIRPIRTPLELLQRCFWSLALIMLFWSTVYPWYLLWTLPFLCLFPSPGWLLFSGLVVFSHARYVNDHRIEWVRYAEYLPVYALLLLEICSPRFRAAWAKLVGIESPHEKQETADAATLSP